MKNQTTLSSIVKAAISSRVARSRCIFVALSLTLMGSAGCAQAPPTKDELLARANDALATEQFVKAEKAYRDVLRLVPDEPTALSQLGILYHDQGQVAQAYPLLKRAAELLPDDLPVQLKFGWTLLSVGQYQEAGELAAQVLDKHAGEEEALLLIASSAAGPNGIADARKAIGTRRDNDQDRASYHLALGSLSAREENWSDAEKEFNDAIQLNPKTSAGYVGLASLYWKRNNLKEADEAFKTAADLAPPRSPVRLGYADFKFRTGAVQEAKDILEDISRKTPDFLPPRVYRMKVACAEQQGDDCSKRVQQILAQDPTNYDAVYQEGVLSLASGDSAKAVRDFEYLSNAYGRNPQVRYQLALAYLLTAKNASPVNARSAFEGAESRLSEALKLNPRFEQAVLLFAELKIRRGNAAAAIDPLTQLIKERPQVAQAYYLLGTCYLAQREPELALQTYRSMVALFPNDPQPSFMIGTILLSQGQNADARKAFEKSLEISSDYLPAVERLVDLDLAEKKYDTAMDRVQPLTQKDPTPPQALALRAKIYLVQQDFKSAEADLLKAIELDPKLEPAYRMLAQLYVSSNRQEEAIKELSAFAAQKKTVPILMQLATLYEQRGQFSEARDAYETLLTVDGNFVGALNNLAMLYSEHLGKIDVAYDRAKKAREIAANEPHVADTLGWIQFKRGEYPEAIKLLQEGASKLSELPEVQFHLGMAYYMMGDEQAAQAALQKAADSGAEFPGKDEARERLAVLTINLAAPAARSELEAFVQRRPNDPVAMAKTAELQERDGAFEQAIKTYEKIAADNPQFAPATRQLALLYSRSETPEPKAYDYAVKARQLYPDDPGVAKAIGVLNYKRGFYPQSAEQLQQASARLSDDAEISFYLGQAYYQLKQWTQCKETLERVFTLKLASRLENEAKRTLDECTEASSP